MAGERLHPPGYAEISAVATATSHRHQGSASFSSGPWWIRCSLAARSRSCTLLSENTVAIRLYERLGFTFRREVSFLVVQAPDEGPASDRR